MSINFNPDSATRVTIKRTQVATHASISFLSSVNTALEGVKTNLHGAVLEASVMIACFDWHVMVAHDRSSKAILVYDHKKTHTYACTDLKRIRAG